MHVLWLLIFQSPMCLLGIGSVSLTTGMTTDQYCCCCSSLLATLSFLSRLGWDLLLWPMDLALRQALCQSHTLQNSFLLGPESLVLPLMYAIQHLESWEACALSSQNPKNLFLSRANMFETNLLTSLAHLYLFLLSSGGCNYLSVCMNLQANSNRKSCRTAWDMLLRKRRHPRVPNYWPIPIIWSQTLSAYWIAVNRKVSQCIFALLSVKDGLYPVWSGIVCLHNICPSHEHYMMALQSRCF